MPAVTTAANGVATCKCGKCQQGKPRNHAVTDAFTTFTTPNLPGHLLQDIDLTFFLILNNRCHSVLCIKLCSLT